MTKTKLLALSAICFVIIAGCTPEFKQQDKYARPDWLAGKIYTQLKEVPELSTFAQCLEKTGYDTIIDKSGSYTVFAPDNNAFSAFLEANSKYNSVEDIPLSELQEIVKYHVLQNPWTKEQLRTLDIYGWIDTLDQNNNKPRGFKRQTLLLDKNRKLGIASTPDKHIKVVDTLDSDWYRIVITDSRKYIPIFYQEYFDIYNLSSEDYEFYFDRTIDNPQDIYFAGGKILGDEIFAENGFIYRIDRVVDPLPNAYHMLESDSENASYKEFLDLINLFPEFDYNEDKTFEQPGADEGYVVDSLFELTYPDLTFNILNEQTKPPTGTFGLPSNVTIRYHHGLMAPSNEAFDEFWNQYFVGATKWNNINSTPRNILRIIVNTHMSPNPIYPTDMENGYINGEMDEITVEPSNIIQQQYGSNCTFIGLDKAIVPMAFRSVAGPVYLLRGYSKVMYAIEDAGLISALKRQGENYMFFVESNANTSKDSSLLYNNGQFSLWQIAQGVAREYRLDKDDLRTLLMSHIGTGTPSGFSRKEFIRNLVGNFIIINNETGEVSGTSPTSIGYNGLELKPNYPFMISTESENGDTYEVENWFSFSAPNLYQRIKSNYPAFHSLMVRAGLANDNESRYIFLSQNLDYSVFAPTDSALAEYQYATDTMDTKTLAQFLKFHFVQGDLIFTDGRKPSGYYETARKDESSTVYTTIFSKVYINPGYDEITFPDAEGNGYLTVTESEATNIMTGRDAGESTDIFRGYIITGVIHEIDKVLLFEELNTN